MSFIINPYSVEPAVAPFVNTYSLDFDGVDEYVTLGHPAALQITGALSISCWVKTTAGGVGDDTVAISKDDLVQRSWALWITE